MTAGLCLITGATAGIGRATAMAMAARGARLLLTGRDTERGRRVCEEARSVGSPEAAFIPADLGSLAAVRKLAGAVRSRTDRLDVLINNAGVITRRRTETVDGLELQFAVNHLAPFVITNELRGLLEAAAPARIVTVSSEAHRGGRIDLDDLQRSRRYSGVAAYRQSKLANLLFTRALAERTAGSGVTANALHPGVIGTRLLYDGFPLSRLLKPFMKSPEQGCRTSVYLARAPEVAETTGEYFIDRAPARPAERALDGDLAEALWTASARLSER